MQVNERSDGGASVLAWTAAFERSRCGVRVVLVEGHDDSRETWDMALTLAGFDVRSFASPVNALADIAHDPPEVVVTSIILPIMWGDELARAVRAAPLPKCPVILAATGFPDTFRKEEAGLFDRVLVKPVDVDQLAAELRGLACRPTRS